MADYFEIRHISPSIAFLFARLGALLDSSSSLLGVLPHHSSDPYPQIGDFAVGGSGLGLALGDLYPLLHQSLVWFELVRGVFRREHMRFEVRSGSEERDSTPGIGMARAGADTTTSVPSTSTSSPSFHALKEKCSLRIDVFNKFRDRFQFPEETRARLPRKGEKAYAFAHGEVCFYKAAFLCGLRFLVHPFIMELLHHLKIASEQLMSNSWRIIISYMVIWTTIVDGDMITLNEFVHLYHLKASKETGYYELVPWDRRSCLVVNLPSSFRYWKSRYFFVLGNGWETLSDGFWGDVPRLLHWWETPQPSALHSARCSSFSFFFYLS